MSSLTAVITIITISYVHAALCSLNIISHLTSILILRSTQYLVCIITPILQARKQFRGLSTLPKVAHS